ncbi:MAG: glycoside hydrolase family 38 C-terminal domain-containing protein, partial [Gemmatimonadales bacterium]
HLPALDRARLRAAWAALEPELAARASTGHLALPIGADHHAPHPRLPRLRDALARVDARYRFRVSRWEDYFEAAALELQNPPEVSGELRSSYGYCWTLQGVHATRARLKRLHGTVESRIQRRLTPLVERLGDRTARAELASFERTLVRCQFHDTIAGTVCDEAARAQLVRLEGLDAATADSVRELLQRAAKDEARHGLVLFNSSASASRAVVETALRFFRRDVLVGPPGERRPRKGPGSLPFSLRDERGRVVPVQVLSRRRTLDRLDRRYGYPDLDLVDELAIAVDPGPLPARGLRTLEVREPARAASIPSRSRARASRRTIENRLIRVELAANGTVTLVDRLNRRRCPGLLGLELMLDHGDLYTPSLRPARVSRSIGAPALVADGPLVAALELPWRLVVRGHGTIVGRTRLSVAREEPELRVAIELEQRARRVRLRIGFPTHAAGPAIVGTGERLIRRDGSADVDERAERYVPTAPAHDVVSVGDRRDGLTLLHEGHFEYQWQVGERLSLTLLRAVGELSRGSLPERPGYAGWPTPTPDAEERGPHRIDFRLRAGGLASLRSYPRSGVGMLVTEIVGDDRARDHDQHQGETGR